MGRLCHLAVCQLGEQVTKSNRKFFVNITQISLPAEQQMQAQPQPQLKTEQEQQQQQEKESEQESQLNPKPKPEMASKSAAVREPASEQGRAESADAI